MEGDADAERHESNKENVVPSWVPCVGMRFTNVEEAWKFWINYGGRLGFVVRKRYTNVSKSDGKITSCRYVCSHEGQRTADKRDHLTKCPRAETRTKCEVRMGLIMDRVLGDYKVSDLVLEHNHALHLPETIHLMTSQRKISDLQAFEIETADDSGIGPKAAHELASRQVGGSVNLGYTLRDQKNYLRSKRQREMAYGEAGSMLRWHMVKQLTFEEYKVVGNPLEQTSICSCGQFNRIGILCAHALRVLDLMNIKSLPAQYILKRWTREARSGTIQDSQGRSIIENPRLDALLRYKILSHKFLNLAQRAANFPECSSLVENTLDILSKQVEDKINARTSISGDPCTVRADVTAPNEQLSNGRLKKKEVRTRSSKRQRTWLDKKHKTSKKRHQKKGSMKQEAPEENKNDGAQPQEAEGSALGDKRNQPQEYRVIQSFTELLTGPSTDALDTEELF